MTHPEMPEGSKRAVAKDEAAHAKVEARGELREQIRLAMEEAERRAFHAIQYAQTAQELFAEYVREEE